MYRDRAGQTLPDWSFNLGFNYTLDRFSGNLQVQRLNRTDFDTMVVGPVKAGCSPTLHDLVGRTFRVGARVSFQSASFAELRLTPARV